MKLNIKLWGLKNCDTCKKAMKALDVAGVDYSFIDIRGGDLKSKDIKDWLEAVGPDKLVNKRSTTWRGLPDKEKSKADSPAAAAKLLEANPTLIKRPVIVTSEDVYVGWNKAAQEAVLKG